MQKKSIFIWMDISILFVALFFVAYHILTPSSETDKDIIYLYVHYICFGVLTLSMLFGIHCWRISINTPLIVITTAYLILLSFFYIADLIFVQLKLFIGLEVINKLEAIKQIYVLEGKFDPFSTRIFLAVLVSAMSVIIFFRKARKDISHGLINIITRLTYSLIVTVTIIGVAYVCANKVFGFELVPQVEQKKSLKQILNN